MSQMWVYFQWALSSIAVLVWIALIVGNFISSFRHAWASDEKHVSPVPIVGSMAGVLVLKLAPWADVVISPRYQIVAILPDLLWLVPTVLGLAYWGLCRLVNRG